jgi:membrane-associated PAP2 superfamily phosphatase
MPFAKLDRRWRELIVLLVLVCLTTPVFWLTNLDRHAAAWFYQASDSGNLWPWKDWWLWEFLYQYAYSLTIATVIGALIMIALSYYSPDWQALRRPAVYWVLVIALGPGLVVNLVFKDHWGRPRPAQITEFGGQHHYIPPLQLGDTGEKSFTCGHCSVGFMFFAAYFLSRQRKAFYFALTLIFGLTLGLTRMSAGGHFLSDILWSGYLVFFVGWLVYYAWYERDHISH